MSSKTPDICEPKWSKNTQTPSSTISTQNQKLKIMRKVDIHANNNVSFWFELTLFTIIITGLFVFSNISTITKIVPLVAVSHNGEGLVTNLTIELFRGHNRVLTVINPPIGPDTQESLTSAMTVAKKYSSQPTIARDVIFDFNTFAKIISGPSAGFPITMALISAFNNKMLPRKYVMTGEIFEDGTIGAVGGIVQKTEALKDNNRGLLIPYEQQEMFAPLPVLSYKDNINDDTNNILFLNGINSFNFINYADEKYGVSVKPVHNVETAHKILFKEDSTFKEKKETSSLTPKKILRDIAQKEITTVEEAIQEENLGNKTHYFVAKLENAASHFKQGYYYPAASGAFKTMIEIRAHLFKQSIANKTDYEVREAYLELLRGLRRDMIRLSAEVNYFAFPETKLELLVCSQQRIVWAEYFLTLVIQGLGESTKAPISDDFLFYPFAAQEWLKGSSFFNEHATSIKLEEHSFDLKEYCTNEVQKAKEKIIVAENKGFFELIGAKRFFLSAQLELQRGWYAAACFDAIQASSTIDAIFALENNKMGIAKKINSIELEINSLPSEPYLWATMNREYALLSLDEYKASKSDLDLLNAKIFAARAKATLDFAKYLDGTYIEEKAVTKTAVSTQDLSKTILLANIMFLCIGFLFLLRDIHGRTGSNSNKKSKDQ